MQLCHNYDFDHFELSIREDCIFDVNFFGKNVTFVASKLSARGQFIICLWSMCMTFSHNFKNKTQHDQNQSCDTIALKRRFVLMCWCLFIVPERLREYRTQFELILEGERHVDQSRELYCLREQREIKCRKELAKTASKGAAEENKLMQERVVQAEKGKELAYLEGKELTVNWYNYFKLVNQNLWLPYFCFQCDYKKWSSYYNVLHVYFSKDWYTAIRPDSYLPWHQITILSSWQKSLSLFSYFKRLRFLC